LTPPPPTPGAVGSSGKGCRGAVDLLGRFGLGIDRWLEKRHWLELKFFDRLKLSEHGLGFLTADLGVEVKGESMRALGVD
jgi:hypothetical protein